MCQRDSPSDTLLSKRMEVIITTMKANRNTRILTSLIIGILMISTSFLSIWAADTTGDTAAAAQTAEAAASADTAAEAAAAAGSTAAAASPAFRYEHDPMENPRAAQDIIVNPDAIYGYSPNPDSKRLGSFADADWTDAETVAQGRKEREAYHASMAELYRMIEDMLGQAKNVEEIARAVSRRRNELRLESYGDDTENLEKAKKSNLETYGNEEGPTAEFLYEKYGSWQTVLEKALSSNPGMDACLGLYDEFYDTYDFVDEAMANSPPEAEAGTEAEAEAEADDVADTEAGAEKQTYKVISGDTLWTIAEKQYGDGSKWKVIYEENKNIISEPSLIFPGQELTIPGAA